jgi:dTDP-4-dehydrorhamnose reductase
MTTVVLGAAGQLGRDLLAALAAVGDSATGLTHADLDLCDPVRARRVLEELGARRVLNTAAYHQVDACETHAAEAFAVNAIAVRELGRICQNLGATLVHFSTDFVFGGARTRPCEEGDAPEPESVYATSKLAGEYLARAYCARHLVVRTCGLYGLGGSRSRGGNFVEKMLALAAAGQPIRVVADQIVAPTFSRDLADAVVRLLGHEAAGPPDYYGLYHITNGGHCSWYEFAAAIFAEAGVRADLAPISTGEHVTAARRPRYSVLAPVRWRRLGLPALRPWREALRAYLGARTRLPKNPSSPTRG